MSDLLDTSILIGWSGSSAPSSAWTVSVVSIGELSAGLLLAADTDERGARLQRLTSVLTAVEVLYVDVAVASRYAELRAATGRHPSNDLWIAATALAHSLTLVTADHAQATLPLITARLVA